MSWLKWEFEQFKMKQLNLHSVEQQISHPGTYGCGNLYYCTNKHNQLYIECDKCGGVWKPRIKPNAYNQIGTSNLRFQWATRKIADIQTKFIDKYACIYTEHSHQHLHRKHLY